MNVMGGRIRVATRAVGRPYIRCRLRRDHHHRDYLTFALLAGIYAPVHGIRLQGLLETAVRCLFFSFLCTAQIVGIVCRVGWSSASRFSLLSRMLMEQEIASVKEG